MSHERAFWGDIARSISPSWSIQLGTNWRALPGAFSGVNFFVYVIDVSSGWLCGAALQSAEVERLVREMSAIHDYRGAAAHIWTVAEQGATSSEAQEGALLAAVLALSQTQTYQNWRRMSAAVHAHAIYLLYRPADGSFIGRPAMIGRTCSGGFLEPGDLIAIAGELVRQDTAPSAVGTVATMLRECGGVNVGEMFTAAPSGTVARPGGEAR